MDPIRQDVPLNHADLLQQVADLLRSEMAIVANRRWEDLPDLKRKKVVLASRLRLRAPGAEEAPSVRSLVVELEAESRHQIEAQVNMIGVQIVALQEVRQYWLECLNVSFRKFC